MLKKRNILLTFFGLLFFSLSIIVNAQEDSVKIDTVRIENKNHSKFRKFYQKLLFKKKPTSFPIQPNNNVGDGKYQGKIIHEIFIAAGIGWDIENISEFIKNQNIRVEDFIRPYSNNIIFFNKVKIFISMQFASISIILDEKD